MIQSELKKAIEYLKSELAKLRAGRASIELVENIEVAAYNSKMSLKQLATLSIPEPRLILIRPWDKSIIKSIESAIRSAMSDVNPIVESDFIRISFPAPTEEKRRELVREVGRIIEGGKIKIRKVREEALQELKSKEDNGEISEDAMYRQKDEIQKLVDEYNSKAEDLGQRKESEIMTI